MMITRYTANSAEQNYNKYILPKMSNFNFAESFLVYFIGERNISSKIEIITIVTAAILLITMYLYKITKHKRILAKPFPPEWEKIIQKNVPLYNRLPDTLKQQLHSLVKIFLSEKEFEGCGGVKITDEIKVTIASQACMLLLNRKTSVFKKLHTILVYPQTYAAKTVSSDGIVTMEGHSIRLGESWQNGPVVLAWDSITSKTSEIGDAQNVVLHEFAHQLDQEDGSANGAPILENKSSYITWARILGREYESLQKNARKNINSVIDTYGATNPAEFFAVVTEAFFENPQNLQKNHPELYRELSNYYNLNPAEWQ
ncbi:MAG: zinc-dependent peptidase [Sedimentisphaerales bacterium]|nr:zinc-dependent peptidase [Sedimentisphaerales bacterium]